MHYNQLIHSKHGLRCVWAAKCWQKENHNLLPFIFAQYCSWVMGWNTTKPLNFFSLSFWKMLRKCLGAKMNDFSLLKTHCLQGMGWNNLISGPAHFRLWAFIRVLSSLLPISTHLERTWSCARNPYSTSAWILHKINILSRKLSEMSFL